MKFNLVGMWLNKLPVIKQCQFNFYPKTRQSIYLPLHEDIFNLRPYYSFSELQRHKKKHEISLETVEYFIK